MSVREKRYSLGGGNAGSRFWIEEWGYPDIAIGLMRGLRSEGDAGG